MKRRFRLVTCILSCVCILCLLAGGVAFAADAAAQPAASLDSPDIDQAAVDRAFAGWERRRARRQALAAGDYALNEPPAPSSRP